MGHCEEKENAKGKGGKCEGGGNGTADIKVTDERFLFLGLQNRNGKI